MDRQITIINKPEVLLDWIDENDLLMGIDLEDARILLDYMEGHGYGVGSDPDGKLYRQDLNDSDEKTEEYSMDDLIDAVCEWNYSMILVMDSQRRNPDNFLDFTEKQNKYEDLKIEEQRLNRMFDKTIYAKQIEELAEELANEAIRNMTLHKEEVAVSKVCEGIKTYQADNKGR